MLSQTYYTNRSWSISFASDYEQLPAEMMELDVTKSRAKKELKAWVRVRGNIDKYTRWKVWIKII